MPAIHQNDLLYTERENPSLPRSISFENLASTTSQNTKSEPSACADDSPSSAAHGGVDGAVASGGGNRIRTGDFLLAKQALYQLSYAPGGTGGPDRNRTCDLVLIRDAL